MLEIDQSIQDSDDVIDAKDEWIKYGCTAKLQSAMYEVKLPQIETDQADLDQPRLPSIELINAVNYSANQKLNSRLGH